MSKKTKTQSSSSMDPQQRAMLMDVYGRAQDVVGKPYNPYEGSTLAGFTNNQTDAFGMVRDAVNSNVGGAALNTALAGTQGAMGRSVDNVGQYMNPYLQQVAGNAMSDLDRTRMLQMQQGSNAATAAKAFGGSRHGVAEAETNRNFYDTAGKTLTDIYSRGFDTATGLANTDMSRQLQASGQMAGLSEQQRQQAFGNAAALEGVGAKQQGMEQAQLDDQYARFLEAENFDRNNVGFLANIVNGMPSMGGTTSGSSAPSQFDSLMKLGSTGALMMMASDENIKSGRRKINEDEVLRGIENMPVEAWRYDPAKGGPDDGGAQHIGPMAQQAKKNLGIGNGKMIPVVDAIGTQFAATKALAKKVKKLEAKKGKK